MSVGSVDNLYAPCAISKTIPTVPNTKAVPAA